MKSFNSVSMFAICFFFLFLVGIQNGFSQDGTSPEEKCKATAIEMEIPEDEAADFVAICVSEAGDPDSEEAGDVEDSEGGEEEVEAE